MLTIKNYVRPKTLDEAYTLCQKRTNVVLGGMLWLKMQNRTVANAIDLCDLGLDQIREKEDGWHIGAMVSLRTLELHPGLNQMTQGAFADAVCHIVGVQFRNCATVGGSIYGRFGFSDVLTLFAVLQAKVCLHHRGVMELSEFMELPRSAHDILTEIIVPKKQMAVRYLTQRNTETDFPVVACAVSAIDGVWTCAVGARPEKAVVMTDDTGMLQKGITPETAAAFGDKIADQTRFGSNVRGSVAYRRKVCSVLIRRAVLSIKEEV